VKISTLVDKQNLLIIKLTKSMERIFKDREVPSGNFLQKMFLIVRLTLVLLIMSSLSLLAVELAPAPISAQQPGKTVTGKVTDQTGGSLPGATVVIKGTSTGITTDMDGNYSLNLTDKSKTLVFSFIGMKTVEVAIDNKSKINTVLEPQTVSLDDVVVTAFGIKRETKALGYSVQEVKGEALTEARENNIVNSLAGKVAGVQINRSGNGPGGSSRIVIRGENSISGNNQPLVVVDGIPMSNWSGGADSQWGGIDRGSGMSDINPDDVESITVLKGPSAAALYGSRAGNGVLMITTKKGSVRKGVGIKLNSNVTFDNPLVLPEMQNTYGQGSGGKFDSNGQFSWGAKMDGQLVTDWTKQERPFSAYDNNIKDFLRTGLTTNNTVEMNAGSENVTFWGALSYLNNNSAIPNSSMDRTTATFRTTANLSKKLSVDTKFTYTRQSATNRPYLSGSPENVFLNYLLMPRSVHYSDMIPARDAFNNIRNWSDRNKYMVRNPYWTTDYDSNSDKRDRIIGFISFQYKFTEWMNLKLRHGEDFYYDYNDSKTVQGTPYGNFGSAGDYNLGTGNSREENTDILLSMNKDNIFGSKFSGSLSFGGNTMHRRSDGYSMSSNGLVIPDFFSMSNAKNLNSSNSYSQKSIHSAYGFMQMNYNNYLYLDITGRNDWSSTLPSENRSFFYPSFSLGWVVSDMAKSMKLSFPSFISFLKLRGSYAEVGNDAGAYQLLPTYSLTTVIDGVKGATPPSTIPLFNLKPELVKSKEFGVDLRMFNNRLGLDFSYYKKNATNQILALPISVTTGKSYRMINAGDIQNSGIEFILRGTPVKTAGGFQWDVTVNYSANKNKIISLHPEAKEYLMASTDFIRILAVEGSSYGDMLGRTYKRDDKGNRLIGTDGLPLIDDNLNGKVGNYNPKWTGGMLNSFSYKGVDVSFLIDVRWGGNIYINSLSAANVYGTSAMSLEGRAAWYAGTGGYVAKGVNSTTGAVNTIAVSPEAYWNDVANVAEEYVYDATNIRLRELSIGYNIPKTLLNYTPFVSAKLSMVGRNLWLIKSDVPGFDPESAYSTGNGQGIEYGSIPSFKSIGFNLNIGF
jgi:TonB-linked SusC/RagA family outer membrane protein